MPDQITPDPEDMTEETRPLHERLLADGADWRAQVPDTTALSQFLDSLARPKTVDIFPEQEAEQFPSPLAQADGKTPLRRLSDLSFDSDEQSRIQTMPPAKAPSLFRRVILAPVAAILIIALSVIVFTIVRSHAGNSNASCWVVPSPASTLAAGITLSLPQGQSIAAAAVTSRGDAWAVGEANIILPDGTVKSGDALLLHLEGNKWVSVCDHVFPGVSLEHIAAFSPTDIWAIGTRLGPLSSTPLPLTPTPEFGTSAPVQPVFLHFDGMRWSEIPVFSGNGSVSIDALQTFSPTSGFAVLGTSRGQAVLWYDNGKWSAPDYNVFPHSNQTPFAYITPAGPHELWAVSRGTIFHEQNGTWTPSYTLHPSSGKDDSLYGLDAISPTDVWALVLESSTSFGAATGVSSFFIHFDGHSWRRAAFDSSTLPAQATPVGFAGTGWGNVDVSINDPVSGLMQDPNVGYVLHLVNGQWHPIRTPPGQALTIVNVSPTVSWGIISSDVVNDPTSVLRMTTQRITTVVLP